MQVVPPTNAMKAQHEPKPSNSFPHFLIIVFIHFLPHFQCQTFLIDTLVGHRFYDGEGGLASHVLLDYPYNVAFHPITDELFIVDTYNHVIRKVDKTSGVITTVAGTPELLGFSGDGGLATKAHLFVPMGVAFSLDGESMYIADNGKNHVRMVRMVSPQLWLVTDYQDLEVMACWLIVRQSIIFPALLFYPQPESLSLLIRATIESEKWTRTALFQQLLVLV